MSDSQHKMQYPDEIYENLTALEKQEEPGKFEGFTNEEAVYGVSMNGY